MSMMTAPRKLVARAGLAVAGFALASCGADDLTKQELAGYTQAASAIVAVSKSQASDPVAVFVDGPTGYTFVWSADTGWKFVGPLGDEAH